MGCYKYFDCGLTLIHNFNTNFDKVNNKLLLKLNIHFNIVMYSDLKS